MVYPGCGIELDWDFATKGVLRVVVLNYVQTGLTGFHRDCIWVVVLNYSLMFRQD